MVNLYGFVLSLSSATASSRAAATRRSTGTFLSVLAGGTSTISDALWLSTEKSNERLRAGRVPGVFISDWSMFKETDVGAFALRCVGQSLFQNRHKPLLGRVYQIAHQLESRLLGFKIL